MKALMSLPGKRSDSNLSKPFKSNFFTGLTGWFNSLKSEKHSQLHRLYHFPSGNNVY